MSDKDENLGVFILIKIYQAGKVDKIPYPSKEGD